MSKRKWIALNAAGWLLTLALLGGALWSLEYKTAHAETIATEAMLEARAALAYLDGAAEYLLVVETLAGKVNGHLTPQEVVAVAQVIIEQCRIHRDVGLTPAVVLAVIEQESGFRPDVISHAGARGLMQLIRGTAEPHLAALGLTWSEAVIHDPVINVRVGIAELIRLHLMYVADGIEARTEWSFSVHAYFWGPINTAQLIAGDPSGRVKVPNMAYAAQVLQRRAAYWEAGLQ